MNAVDSATHINTPIMIAQPQNLEGYGRLTQEGVNSSSWFPDRLNGHPVSMIADHMNLPCRITADSESGVSLLVGDPGDLVVSQLFARQLVRVTCGARIITGTLQNIRQHSMGKFSVDISLTRERPAQRENGTPAHDGHISVYVC